MGLDAVNVDVITSVAYTYLLDKLFWDTHLATNNIHGKWSFRIVVYLFTAAGNYRGFLLLKLNILTNSGF